MAFDDDNAVKELVPLEGDEEGVGSFLGSICFQYSLGNLEPCERKMKAKRRVKSKHLYLQEPNIFRLLLYSKINMDTRGELPLTLPKLAALERVW